MVAERLPRALDKRLFGEGFVAADGGGPYKARRPRPNSNPHGSIPDYYREKLDEQVRREARRVAGELSNIRKRARGAKCCCKCGDKTNRTAARLKVLGWKRGKGGRWTCGGCLKKSEKDLE